MEYPNETPPPRKNWPLPMIAAILVTILYLCGSWSNRFVYDDHEVIENHSGIHSWSDLAKIFTERHYLNYPYYRPITRTTFLLQKTIWGNEPRPYHIFNAVLAGLVLLAAYALLRWPGMRLPMPAALIGALWFAVHPALSECVYPAASGRETLMPALIILLALSAFVHPGRRWYWLAVGCFAVALLCKELAVVLPGIFLLADICGVSAFGGDRQNFSQWSKRYVPVGIVFLLYFGIRHLIFRGPTIFIEIQHDWLAPLFSFLYGLQTAITPFMELRYEPPKFVWWDSRLCIVALVFLAIMIFACFRSPKQVRNVCIFWVGWFILLQLPTAHIVRQEAPYSERYAALAILAVPAMVGVIAASKLRSASAKQASLVIATLWLVILAYISFWRGSYYTDDTAFDIQWANVNPGAVNAYIGLGTMAESEQNFPRAIEEFNLALQADPQSVEAHSHLANSQAAMNDYRDAQQNYEWVLRAQPDDTVAMVNYAQTLGALAFQAKDRQLSLRAKELLDRAIQIKPDYAQAHLGLAIWSQTFGDHEAALREIKWAHKLQPDRQDILKKLEQMQMPPTSRPIKSTVPTSGPIISPDASPQPATQP